MAHFSRSAKQMYGIERIFDDKRYYGTANYSAEVVFVVLKITTDHTTHRFELAFGLKFEDRVIPQSFQTNFALVISTSA